MAPSRILVQCVAHCCAFAYATANTALYAVLLLTVADFVSDALENRFQTPPEIALGSDIVSYVVLGILLGCLLVSNHISYARRVAALFFVRDVEREKLSLRAAGEKFCAVGGTYLKAVASTVSLAQLISRFLSPSMIGLCIAFPLFPLNAAAQFSVIGEQFSIRLLLFALFVLVEVCAIGAVAFGITYLADQDHHAVVLVMEVVACSVLFIEMACLVATDRSLVGLFVLFCCCKKPEEKVDGSLLAESVHFGESHSDDK